MTDKEEILVAIAKLSADVNNAIDRADEDRSTIKDQGTRISKLENEKSKLYGMVGGITVVVSLLADSIKKQIGI